MGCVVPSALLFFRQRLNQKGAGLVRPLKSVRDRLFGYRSNRQFALHADNRVVLLHNSGFFSNCSALLMSVARAQNHPLEIDVTQSFTHFTESGKPFQWADYFVPPPSTMRGAPRRWPRSRVAKLLPHHSIYKLLDYSVAGEIRDNYFQLSDKVHARVREIEESHLPVSMEDVLVVCLRGTDKGTEVRQSPIGAYVHRARRIMEKHKNLRVWVQTDQAQIRDTLLEQLGPRSFSLDILPVTEDAQVLHRSPAVSSKADFSRDLLAITWLMSRAHSVITYTGNVGYWIALFRGHGGRLHQLR